MSNLVIVAIPDENDRVWKVSSEKVPHLTVLFLGDADNPNVEQITQFVEHAANTTLKRFYLPVDRRGELGDDKADVLFFKKTRYDFKAIRDFRAQLLKDHNIKSAFDGADQYEQWNPHLTMGYPATPAKKDDSPFDQSFYDVCFNRIAVWFGDYEGPEFLLKDYWDEMDMDYMDMDIPVSDVEHSAELEAFFSHVGIKGMKWGQSKTETITVGSKTKQVTPKKATKADEKWAQDVHSLKGALALHNGMADHFNQRIGSLNDKYKDDDFSKEGDNPSKWSPRYKAYNNDALKLTDESYHAAIKASPLHKSSPTGKKKAILSDDATEVLIVNADAKHAADDEGAIRFKLVRNDKGLVTEIQLVEDSMAQTAELGEAFLAHHGIKGMKWGHRTERAAPTASEPSAMSVVPHGDKKKTKISVEGGENHPAHSDAIKVAESTAKLKKSGVAALSNKELADVAKRKQLEAQVTGLTSSKSKKFVSNLLRQQGQQSANRFVTEKVKSLESGAKAA